MRARPCAAASCAWARRGAAARRPTDVTAAAVAAAFTKSRRLCGVELMASLLVSAPAARRAPAKGPPPTGRVNITRSPVDGGQNDAGARSKSRRGAGALLDRHAPVDAVLFGRVVARRAVIRAAVVPDDDVALAPAVPILGARLDHVAGQLLDERVALRLVEPLDPEDLAGIEVERLLTRLRMRPDDRMEHRLPAAILLVEQGGRLPPPAVGEGPEASV